MKKKKIYSSGIDFYAVPHSAGMRHCGDLISKTDCSVITCRPRSENTKKIVDFLFSPAGQELIRKVGYTPVGRNKPQSE